MTTSLLDLIEQREVELLTQRQAEDGVFRNWYDPLRGIKSRGSQARRPGSLAGLNELREETKSQFFTPSKLVSFMWQLVYPYMERPSKGMKLSVFDNSFGSGRMFQFCNPEDHHLVGCEIDEDLVTALITRAKEAGFEFAIEHASMEEIRVQGLNLAMLNPPFSIMIDNPVTEPFESGSYGKFGPKSSHKSHAYALAQALKACAVVEAVVPRHFADQVIKSSFFRPRLKRIFHLPKKTFLEENVIFDMSLLVFDRLPCDAKEKKLYNLKDLEFHREYLTPLDLGWWGYCPKMYTVSADASKPVVTEAVTGNKRVRVCHSGRKLVLKFECGLAKARVLNRVFESPIPARPAAEGRVPKGLRFIGEGRLDIENYLAQKIPLAAFQKFVNRIESWGYDVEVDPGVIGYIKKRTREIPLLTTPVRHMAYVIDGGLKTWMRTRKEFIAVCKRENKLDIGGATCIDPRVFPGEKIKVRPDGDHFVTLFQRQYVTIKYDHLMKYYSIPDFSPDSNDWVVVHPGLKAHFPKRYLEAENRAKALGLDQWLSWGYQFDDMVEISLRRGKTIVAWEMGLGKARLALALCYMGRGKHNLIVIEARLMEEMLIEIKTLGLPKEDWQVIRSLKDTENLRKINIISYSKLRTDEVVITQTKKKKKKRYPIADALRRRIHTLVADEAQAVKNYDTNQSIALSRVCARVRYGETGTPIDNYPRDVLPIAQAMAGEGTVEQPYGHHHAFLHEANVDSMSHSTRGVDVFKDLFVTFEWVTNEFAEDLRSGAKREIPKIKNIKAFRHFVAPIIKRRLRDEPEVAKYIHIPEYSEEVKEIEWDTTHLAYYYKASQSFVDWYRKGMDSDEKKRASLVAILHKIQGVINAANYPQGGVAGLRPYSGMTSKQRYALERLKQLVFEGQKIVFLAESPHTLNFFSTKLKEEGIDHVLFHGDILINKRVREMDERFRKGDCPVLLASKGCLQTGYNIHQANWLLFYDRNWTPKTDWQVAARLLRPQQKRKVFIEFFHLAGSIDVYQAQLCDFKAVSMRAGLDYGEDDLDPKDFQHIETILGNFVKDFEAQVGIKIDDLVKQELSYA